MPMLFDPFEHLRDFQRALDEFRSSGWLGSGMSAGGAYPPINIFRKGDDIVAIIEVPGVRKSDLDIRVERNTLRIAGSKSVDYGDKAAMHRRERSPGRFDRVVTHYACLCYAVYKVVGVSRRSASISRSSAVRSRTSQITGLPARSACSRCQAARSRSRAQTAFMALTYPCHCALKYIWCCAAP